LDNHVEFINYLNFLQQHLNLTIIIKMQKRWSDLQTKELQMALIPYMIHSNPYCNLIKSNKSLLKKCCSMGTYIEKKCITDRSPFYGYCHAGAEEFIMPVFANDNELIGILAAGNFKSNNPKSICRIEKINNSGIFENGNLEDCYHMLPDAPPLSLEMLENALGIAAKYLADLYIRPANENLTPSYTEFNTNENGILGKVLDIISKHSEQALSVPELASKCNCSVSFLNHLFKRSTGTNIRSYINWVRIEKARPLLKDQSLNISEIASLVGFNDADYFSKIFTSLTSQTPSAFRKRIHIQSTDKN
jgi:AraC-like DNA-binding protein